MKEDLHICIYIYVYDPNPSLILYLLEGHKHAKRKQCTSSFVFFFHFHPNPKILICLKTNKKSESARKPKKSESAWKPKNLNLLEGGAWHGAVNLPLLTHLLLTSHNPLSPLFLWDQDMTCGGIMIWWLFVLMILSMILDNTKARGLVYFKKIQEIKEGK